MIEGSEEKKFKKILTGDSQDFEDENDSDLEI
jgi:hypothetical protein